MGGSGRGASERTTRLVANAPVYPKSTRLSQSFVAYEWNCALPGGRA